MTLIGKVECMTTINGKERIEQEFRVVEQLGETILMGNDWLKKGNVKIDWKKEEMIVKIKIRVGEREVEIATISKSIKIAGRSVGTIDIKIPTDGLYVVTDLQKIMIPGIRVRGGIVESKNGKATIQIVNTNVKDVIIRKKKKIASVELGEKVEE